LPNLKKTAFIVFIYSMLFTSLVSFFAFMIIPDARTRLGFKDNLIAGLAMNVVGPFTLRLLFHGFVVVVGIMILSGAANTGHRWLQRGPQPRFGRRCPGRLVPAAASALRDFASDH